MKMKIEMAYIFTDFVGWNMSSDSSSFCDNENLYNLEETENCNPYRLVNFKSLNMNLPLF